jgi:hypothetical protein
MNETTQLGANRPLPAPPVTPGLPALPEGSRWTIIADLGVIKGRRALRVQCSCEGAEPVLRRADIVISGRSLSCERCAPGRRGAKQHQNAVSAAPVAEPAPYGEQAANRHVAKPRWQRPRQKALAPSPRRLHHDLRVLRPGCGCSICGYNRKHWVTPIPARQSVARTWNVELRNWNLDQSRATTLMEYGSRPNFVPGADPYVPAGKNLTFVGGGHDLEELDAHHNSGFREFGGKRVTAPGHGPERIPDG